MNILDIVLIISFIMFIIVGMKRGVIKEIVSLVGIILVFVFSFSLKGIIGNLFCYIFPFFDFGGPLKGLYALNIFFYQAIAFLIMYGLLIGIYQLCLRISKFIQKIVNMTIILWIPSKILGGIVSLLKGYVIIYAILLLIIIPFGNNKTIIESKILNVMINNTPVLSQYVQSFVKPLNEIYDLSESVANNKITTNKANIESIDIMLKYKIVSKNTVIKLIELEKLKNVKGIESVLKNY